MYIYDTPPPPLTLMAVGPLLVTLKPPRASKALLWALEMWMRSGAPVDSIREAVLTVSPKRQ